MARYLITGIAGFMGSWLARDLVSRGEIVRGLDNLSTGSLNNLEGIEASIELLHDDLRNPAALELACRNVDYIFHLAAIDSVERSIEDPADTSDVNLEGTLHLIAAAQQHGVKRLVFASSAAVYGDRARPPIAEDALPNPQSPFAAQKLTAEQHLANAAATSALETVSLRYFTVFGPRQSAAWPDAGVIAHFVTRMLGTDQSGPIIHGDGDQLRDFVYVSDAVNATYLAMHAPAGAVSGKVFNVGSGRGKSLRIAFETLAAMAGFTGQPRFVQAPPLDARRSIADLTQATEAFGYTPKISFADGLYKTVTGYRQQMVERPAKPAVERRRTARSVPPALPRVAPGRLGDRQPDRHIDAQVFAQAVQSGELELFYQPILDLRESRVAAVEALLRWRTGGRLLTPAHFLDLAEEKGLTSSIGTWVLETACAELAQFQRDLRQDLRLSLNLSPMQLEQPGLMRTVDAAVERSGLAPTMLDVEVLERTLVRDCAATQQNLMHLRRRGVRIAVDDFGTGYSNMNYLCRFPIDCIKIDQSFVQHRGHTKVLQGIVAFAQTLGVHTIAEGVETPYQLTHVRDSGCDAAQGFFIGRPVPATHLVSLIETFEGTLEQTAQALNGQLLNLPMPRPDQASEASMEGHALVGGGS
jgi:UDP-glucose 4-epimerase